MGLEPVGTIDSYTVAQARDAERVQQLEYSGIPYLRFSDKHHTIPRGTVVLGDRIVPGYPPIGRIFVLENGLRANFAARFCVEEKIDGYNVRIVSFEGRILAFTRGGFVCPFTTDRLPDLANFEPLLDTYPDMVVCAEVTGPGNPYISLATPHATDDIALFAFDLMQLDTSRFVPLARRDQIFERFAIPQAPCLGIFAPDQIPQLRAELLDLDRRGVEGIVFKPIHIGPRIKYVTPRTNVADIVMDAPLLAELPEAFFDLRLLRLAFGISEFGLHARIPAVEQELGHALVSGLLDTVERVRAGGVVSEQATIKLHSDIAATALLQHLNRASRKIQVHEVDRTQRDGYIWLTFEKTYLTSTSRIKTLLAGSRVID